MKSWMGLIWADAYDLMLESLGKGPLLYSLLYSMISVLGGLTIVFAGLILLEVSSSLIVGGI